MRCAPMVTEPPRDGAADARYLRACGPGRDRGLLRGLGLDAAGASALWLVAGLASLAAFAWLLARAPSDFAGRAYAAYGGVYVAASLAWLWVVEGQRPDGRDVAGGQVRVVGEAVNYRGQKHGPGIDPAPNAAKASAAFASP